MKHNLFSFGIVKFGFMIKQKRLLYKGRFYYHFNSIIDFDGGFKDVCSGQFIERKNTLTDKMRNLIDFEVETVQLFKVFLFKLEDQMMRKLNDCILIKVFSN